MRRQLAIFWLAVILCLAGASASCPAQSDRAAPDIPALTIKAQSGDTGAMISLGQSYLEGRGTERDLDAAISWLDAAAKAGDLHAVYLLSSALAERAKPGDLDRALLHGRNLLAKAEAGLAESGGDPFGERSRDIVLINIELGNIYRKLGRLPEAIAALDAAREISGRVGLPDPLVGAAYANLAAGLGSAGRFAEAVAANEAALSIFAELGEEESHDVAGIYMNQGAFHYGSARYRDALQAFERARAMLVKLGSDKSPLLADVLNNMSVVHMELDNFKDALDILQKALAHHRMSPSPSDEKIAHFLANIGWANMGLDRHDEARTHYEAAREVFDRIYGPSNLQSMRTLVNLGTLDDDLGKHEDALTGYRRAMAIAVATLGPDHAEVGALLARIANTSRRLGRHDEAIDSALQAYLIQTGSADTDLDNMRYTFRTLALALSARGNRSAALLFAKKAVNTHQAVRGHNAKLTPQLRSALGESFQSSYRSLSGLLLADGLFSEAQFVAGLLKQEEFFDFTRRGAGTPHEFEPDSIRLTKLEERIEAAIEKTMQPAHLIAAELGRLAGPGKRAGAVEQNRAGELLRRRDAALREFIAAARGHLDRAETDRLTRQREALETGQHYSQKLQADLKAMGPNVVLLQAMSLEDGLHLFVSAAHRGTAHREIPVRRPDLAGEVFAAVSSVESRGGDAVNRLAKLYDLLIRPVRRDIEAALDRQSRHEPVLVLDLSGFLRYVPFAALNDEGRFLVEDFALARFNPAIPPKFSRPDRTQVNGTGFGVAGKHPGFAALPGVAAELETIFRGADGIGFLDGVPVMDASFDESSLLTALTKRPQILHIASHFRFRPGNETNSYLLLGDGKGLSLDRLRTEKQFRFAGVDLLILSACETARGGGAEGEEIESFGALAQANGASAVMSTLWQIADDSTARLMRDFYDGFINHGLDKAGALRRAQIAMIKGEAAGITKLQPGRAMSVIETAGTTAAPSAHPYHWAAFILMGNWK
ncbi:CHAT domain-containing protein [Taklimakanibacter lacteus]|uniref:CHAT domain-containing protein n=1 Tax=Taklimakanibacter lacteus TaxID=2268456 RepID=UPI000E65ED76